MRRFMLAATTASVALAVSAIPASAITGGELDAGRHPAVGALLADLPDVGRVTLCSGTLVAPNVFLTAGHCTAELAGLGVTRVLVSFSETVGPGNELHGGSYVTDPAFGTTRADTHDLAVVLLDEHVVGVTPATLPGLGFLDSLGSRKVLGDQLFTSVGYGYYDRAVGGGPPRFLYDGQRRVARSPFSGLSATELDLRSKAKDAGLGGVCFGDSGGPNFVGDSMTLAALTSGGSTTCKGTSVSYRLDTVSARAFLSRFVLVP